MKTILVPTDFSDCAKNATDAALELAARVKSTIYFLHIMPNPNDKPHVPGTGKIVQSNSEMVLAKNELNNLVAKAEKLGLKATPLLAFDKGNERIENYITPLEIDLIVMGSHGATGIRELVIGSTTQRVVRHSTVPVLVIKNLIAPFKVENILFASTFEINVKPAFDFVIQVAKLWNAQVHLLFVNFKDKTLDKKTMNSIGMELLKPYPEIQYTINSAETNDEEWLIHQFVDTTEADLIALTTYDKTGFIRAHSVAEDLVNHEEVPVLVLTNE